MGSFDTTDFGQIKKPRKGKMVVHGFYKKIKLISRLSFPFREESWSRGFTLGILFFEQAYVVPVFPDFQEFMYPGNGEGEEYKPCKDDGYAHCRDRPSVVCLNSF
jgi:hypothetical protein